MGNVQSAALHHTIGLIPHGVSVHMYWYLGRSSGFVAYWLLFSAVAMGLAVSSRVFDGVLGRPWVFEVHKFLSLFVLIIMVFHALIMIPDPYAKFTFGQMLVPLKSHYRNLAVSLGIITLYGSIIISATFYMKGMIGQNMWRTIHYLTFGLFVTAMAHGLWAGSDTKVQYVQMSYAGSGVAVLFLTFFRILAARSVARRPARAPASAVTAS